MSRDGQSPPGLLPSRPVDSHKGTFGTVMVIGGCDDADSCMVGGPAFSALGALRSGAGRVVMATPRGILGHCLEVSPSATGIPIDSIPFDDESELRSQLEMFQTIVLGPGLGTGSVAERLVSSILSCRSSTPIVIDADAINIAARDPGQLIGSHSPCVLTPHPGEYRRLAHTLGISESPTSDTERIEAAMALSQAVGAIAVLKGAGTVVASGDSVWACDRGTPALATAGTGDVLAGIIAGLVAQSISLEQSSLWRMAAWGVWIHAVSGERWSANHGDSGLLAAELAAEVPGVMQSLPRS
ncbi:MAG: NAD(P)H-hydrate dehydratase [Phycisphaerae bacterium]|nr:NAD(P)H-hydrate dehydratase [Phycisphaerae bacterium]